MKKILIALFLIVFLFPAISWPGGSVTLDVPTAKNPGYSMSTSATYVRDLAPEITATQGRIKYIRWTIHGDNTAAGEVTGITGIPFAFTLFFASATKPNSTMDVYIRDSDDDTGVIDYLHKAVENFNPSSDDSVKAISTIGYLRNRSLKVQSSGFGGDAKTVILELYYIAQ